MIDKNSIDDWCNIISSLPDENFFEIIRLYLGEVKTPYNKHRLVEQLASFIRNEKNLETIICFLDEFDIKILTAIHFIPNATTKLLADFFIKDYSLSDIYSQISNLTLRLLIYSEKAGDSEKKYLRINPLVLDKLEPLLKISNILMEEQVVSYSMEDVFCLSPDFLAAFISYIHTNGCSCKQDGTIKKNDANKLEKVFPGKGACLQSLFTAFINLHLLFEGEKTYELDKKRLEMFAELDASKQYALLCAASSSRLSRDGLKKEAQLFLDCISSIPENGYSRSTLIKLAFLVASKSSDTVFDKKKSRFSQILEAAKPKSLSLDDVQAGNIIDRMIDFAVEFGLLQKKGLNADGTEVFIPYPLLKEQENQSLQNPKVVNIESTFTVTIMPALSLSKLLNLVYFLSVKSSGVVSEYEINRQTVSLYFDMGYTPEDIFSELEKYTYYDLPQNLKISIADWYNSYTSAMIYHGYVLKVSEANVTFVENNPNIKKYIKEKLAEGIYLLNIPDTVDISIFIKSSGLEFMGKINNSSQNEERVPFPLLRNGINLALSKELELSKVSKDSTETAVNYSKASELLNNLRKELEAMKLSDNQKESLMNRLRNRLILSKEQLEIASVRTEILEADGMDYAGKLRLFEAAMKSQDMLEITLPHYVQDGQYCTWVGKALGITKEYADAIVRFEVQPSADILNVFVSKVTHIRRLRF